jgi:disulfide oxidoreductase YuzD
MKFDASHIVIDADIARAVGLSEHPTSSTSRALLNAVKESKNIGIAFNAALFTEWRKHQSIFAQTWLSSMIATKRIYRIEPIALTRIEVQNAPITEKHKEIAEKDAHLIDIALVAGKFIASNDKTARAVFCLVSNHSPLFNGITWVVPMDCAGELVALIQERGFIPDNWHISAPA